MKKFLALLLFLGVLPQGVSAQDSTTCDSYRDVPVAIAPVFDEPRLDASQDLDSIQSIASDRLHSIPHNETIAMGITRYRPVLELHVPMVVETASTGLSCARLERVRVTVGYRDVTIFIANEIAKGTCGFSETLGHEQKHVAINRQLLLEFAPRIENELKSYLRLYGSFRVENVHDAEQRLHERVKDFMDDMVEQMRTENLRRQQLVDSRSEYDRLAHVCGGELSRIATHYKKNR